MLCKYLLFFLTYVLNIFRDVKLLFQNRMEQNEYTNRLVNNLKNAVHITDPLTPIEFITLAGVAKSGFFVASNNTTELWTCDL